MFYSKKNIYLQETEVNPNRYATYVLFFTLAGTLFCWVLTELGIFRVGKTIIRIGSSISLVLCLLPLILMRINKELTHDPRLKFVIMAATSLFTLSVTTLMTFHTTIMLLFPIFVAMLYRSKTLGIVALSTSMFCTLFSATFGYLLGAWDIPLFQELILIGTGGTAEIVGATYTWSWLGIGKIFLYLVLPRTIMVGSCSLLMFYVIREAESNVENQILLSEYNRRDRLTGLFNRNAYQDLLEQKKGNMKIAVAFFDVNNLKAANDSRGHEYGDLLLQRCAQSLLAVCDEERIGGFRMGGDEFMLVCVGISEAELMKVLDRVQRELDRINRQNLSEKNDLVCSMAVGWRLGSIRDLDELVRSADEQMYINKQRMKRAQ